MSIRQIADILTLTSPIVLVVGILIGFIIRHKLSRLSKYVLLYFVMALAADGISRILATQFGNNLIMIPLYGLLEILYFLILYYFILKIVKSNLWLALLLMTLSFTIYETINSLNVEPANFNSYSRVMAAICIVLSAIAYYIKNIKLNIKNITGELRLNTFIFIFYSLNLLFFLPLNFLINLDSEVKYYFWIANLLITILFYISLIYWIWKHGRIQTR